MPVSATAPTTTPAVAAMLFGRERIHVSTRILLFPPGRIPHAADILPRGHAQRRWGERSITLGSWRLSEGGGAPASLDVIVDHPGGLHQRVHGRRSHEAEPALSQRLAESLGVLRHGGDVGELA